MSRGRCPSLPVVEILEPSPELAVGEGSWDACTLEEKSETEEIKSTAERAFAQPHRPKPPPIPILDPAFRVGEKAKAAYSPPNNLAY